MEDRAEGFYRSAALRHWQRQHASRSAEANRWECDYPPSLGSNYAGAPVVIRKIEINVTGMLGDTDVNRPFRSIELCPRLEQIECRPDRRRARRVTGGLVIAPPQPGSKSLAADRPRFSVTVGHDIGKCRAGGCVEQAITQRHFAEHVDSR